jgi:predicted metalloprotease with PDZ domain
MKRMWLLVAVLLVGVAGSARAENFERRFTMGGGPRMGVQVTLLTEELRAHFGAQKDAGVLVGKIEPGSAAEKAGVRVGDVIVTVGGTTVGDASDVREALSAAKEGETLPITVVRERKPLTLAVKVPKAEPAGGYLTAPDGAELDFPREFGPRRMFKVDDLGKRLEDIEQRLRKLEGGEK